MAGLIGNVLEWFDFAVYGYFASNIGHQFFPKSDPTAQQFLAFAVFALGFLARPAGSLVLGCISDRIGRRALLTLSIALMGGATLVMGLLPTYNQIGIAAPVLLMWGLSHSPAANTAPAPSKRANSKAKRNAEGPFVLAAYGRQSRCGPSARPG